jgi:hypothetical protein
VIMSSPPSVVVLSIFFRKAVTTFLLLFYSFGIFCLPMADFSMLGELPDMYRNCKAMEDKDMTPFDFVTDHLINIDGLFDKHPNGDKQKPHQNSQSGHHEQNPVYFLTYCSYLDQHLYPIVAELSMDAVMLTPVNFISDIFHPPKT